MATASYNFLLSAVLGCSAAAAPCRAATFETLYSFAGADAGQYPNDLSLASNGRIYGTTSLGGVRSGRPPAGTLFVVGQQPAYSLPIQTLSSFHSGAGGFEPEAPPTLGQNDILFGTTFVGGRNKFGYGEIYSYNLHTSMKSLAYGFTPTDPAGFFPRAAMVVGKNGVFFGTTSGSIYPHCSCGTVFRFDSTTGKVEALHVFTGGEDGKYPNPLTFNPAGTLLYGTTRGDFNGTIFTIDPDTKVLTTLHTFTGTDGAVPLASVVFDGKGNLYGTARGEANGRSTIFKMAAGTGVFTVLAILPVNDLLASPLTVGRNGLLYGTAYAGGVFGQGSVFSLNPASGAFETLHDFTLYPDGAGPRNLVQTDDGTLYGTTLAGGINPTSSGTLFKIVP